MFFVGGEPVPHDHFPVLGRADNVTLVQGPVHAEDLAGMAFEDTALFDAQLGERFESFRGLLN